MRDFPIRVDLKHLNIPERTLRVLEKAVYIANLLTGQDNLDEDLTNTALLAILTESRVDDLEAFQADGPYVKQDVGPAWADPAATAVRTALPAYTAPAISATYVQAEVQALADQVAALTSRLAGVITDAQANGTLT